MALDFSDVDLVALAFLSGMMAVIVESSRERTRFDAEEKKEKEVEEWYIGEKKRKCWKDLYIV